MISGIDWILTEICSWWLKGHYVSIGTGNGLVRRRRNPLPVQVMAQFYEYLTFIIIFETE